MFLIGQYDSPFVRRVAIAMRLYGIKFDHKPWSTFGDADKIAPYNPLRRVPTLVPDGGEALANREHDHFRLSLRVRWPRESDDRPARSGAAAAFAHLRACHRAWRRNERVRLGSFCKKSRQPSCSSSAEARRRRGRPLAVPKPHIKAVSSSN